MFHSPLFNPIRKYLVENDTNRDTTFVFVPYVLKDTLSELLEGLQNRISIVTTWEPRDLVYGSSDLSVYPYCRDHGIALYVTKNLHLKIYSVGMLHAILATGNITSNGMHGGNYEAGVLVDSLTATDRLFLEGILHSARLVDDEIHKVLKNWLEDNKTDTTYPTLEYIVPKHSEHDFLVSALPMTKTVDLLAECYARLSAGSRLAGDEEVTACVYHDLANYNIVVGLSADEFKRVLAKKFFEHPFIVRISEIINSEVYFGTMKEWVQHNCTDVPIPSRRELTGNVQVLYDWFASLGDGMYVADRPRHSQRLRKSY